MIRDQILDEGVCVSLSTNVCGKGMKPFVLPPAMLGKQGSLALVR